MSSQLEPTSSQKDAGSQELGARADYTFDDDWLQHFYRECGREVTLAYTTLNQMKNWAFAVTTAVTAALVAVSRGQDVLSSDLVRAIVVGSSLAFLFTLRFYVRAILCYINLTRWNTLQRDILSLKLGIESADSASPVTRRTALAKSIEAYYYNWRSPIKRVTQLTSNLKLGFGLLLTIPLLGLIWTAPVGWGDPIVRGAVAFVAGGTAIEAWDFFTSRFFDVPERKRRSEKESIFPLPPARTRYVLAWVANLLLTTIVAFEWCPF